MGSASVQGELWGTHPQDWAELQEPLQTPFYEAVFDALEVSSTTRLLDAGCGAGYAAVLATKRGATVSGVDASAPLLGVAQERLRDADFRVADLEDLPFDDGAFTAVTAFNSVQYAADPVAALRELGRVAQSGSTIAVVTWGQPENCEMRTVLAAIGSLLPPPPPGAGGPFALSAPGALERLVESAGLAPLRAGEVPTPFEFTDLATSWRAMKASGPAARAIREAGEERTRDAVTAAFAEYEQPDGAIRLSNSFRFLLARA